MRLKALLKIVFLIGFFYSHCLGQSVSKTGTVAGGFLNIDVGSRAVGMGSAFVAVADDATAMYWNPAGIARLDNTEAVFSNIDWIADIQLNYAGIVVPTGGKFGSIGLNANFVSMGEMERTTVDFPEGTGEKFSAGMYAFGLAYANSLTDRFSIGFNFKYINENIYHSDASGIAFDVGTLYTTRFKGLQIGMSISNYGSKMRMSGRDLSVQVDVNEQVAGNNEEINGDLRTEYYELPLSFRVGVALDVLKGAANSNLTLAVSAAHPNNNTEYVSLGAEYLFNKMFALRGGFSKLGLRDSEEGLTLGAGLQYKLNWTEIGIDYVFKDFGRLNDIQMFTFRLGF